MTKGSDFLADFEREWFAESGIDPTPDDVERFHASMLYARARVQAELLNLADSLNPVQRRLLRVATWITAGVAWLRRRTPCER